MKLANYRQVIQEKSLYQYKYIKICVDLGALR